MHSSSICNLILDRTINRANIRDWYGQAPSEYLDLAEDPPPDFAEGPQENGRASYKSLQPYGSCSLLSPDTSSSGQWEIAPEASVNQQRFQSKSPISWLERYWRKWSSVSLWLLLALLQRNERVCVCMHVYDRNRWSGGGAGDEESHERHMGQRPPNP